MILNCTKYQRTMNNCLNTIHNDLKNGVSPVDVASKICHLTSVPLAACVMYLMNVCGSSKDLDEKLQVLVEFYKYTEIVPFEVE